MMNLSVPATAASAQNKAAAVWLQVERMAAMQVQWALKIFPLFCIMQNHSLSGGSFSLSKCLHPAFRKQ